MVWKRILPIAMLSIWLANSAGAGPAGPRDMVIVRKADTQREEPTPHGAIGISTVFRLSDAVPGRTMEFRERIVRPGGAIGLHRIAHDEIYYVLSGSGEVSSGGKTRRIEPGTAAYLFAGETVGIRQTGKRPLALIIAYPIPPEG